MPEGGAGTRGDPLFVTVVRKILFGGIQSVPLRPGLNVPVDLAFHTNGELFVCELYAGTVTAYKSAKKVKVVASSLDKPHGLAFDSTGVTCINEWSGNRILKMDQKGRLQQVAAIEDPVGIAPNPKPLEKWAKGELKR